MRLLFVQKAVRYKEKNENCNRMGIAVLKIVIWLSKHGRNLRWLSPYLDVQRNFRETKNLHFEWYL